MRPRSGWPSFSSARHGFTISRSARFGAAFARRAGVVRRQRRARGARGHPDPEERTRRPGRPRRGVPRDVPARADVRARAHAGRQPSDLGGRRRCRFQGARCVAAIAAVSLASRPRRSELAMEEKSARHKCRQIKDEATGHLEEGARFRLNGDPDGIRTRVTCVKGGCPRPLDDGVSGSTDADADAAAATSIRSRVSPDGFEPSTLGLKGRCSTS